MLFSLNRYNKLFIFILSINIGIILGNKKCTSIDNCLKCPEDNKCEECVTGYTLNFDKTKCLEVIQPDNSKSTKSSSSKNTPSASSAQKSPASASSAKKSSASASSAQKSSTSASSAKKSSTSASSASSAKKSSSAAQKHSASSKKSSASSSSAKKSSSASKSEKKPSGSNLVKKASNAPIASNKPFASAFDSNKDTESNKSSLVVKIIIFLVAGCLIFCCIKWLITKGKKNKVGYFYDESGNPDEKAKVVYIQ